jgi:putative sterol carrier protein
MFCFWLLYYSSASRSLSCVSKKDLGETTMTVAESFEAMPSILNPAAAAGMNKVFQWNITGDEAGKWALQIANSEGKIIPGGVEKPDITFTVSDKDWLAISEGKLDPMNAFMTGKLKVAGDMMLAMKVPNLFPTRR